jgi:hypothetical protein
MVDVYKVQRQWVMSFWIISLDLLFNTALFIQLVIVIQIELFKPCQDDVSFLRLLRINVGLLRHLRELKPSFLPCFQKLQVLIPQ